MGGKIEVFKFKGLEKDVGELKISHFCENVGLVESETGGLAERLPHRLPREQVKYKCVNI